MTAQITLLYINISNSMYEDWPYCPVDELEATSADVIIPFSKFSARGDFDLLVSSCPIHSGFYFAPLWF